MSLSPMARPLNPWVWLGAPMMISAAAVMVFAVPLSVFGLRPPEPVFPMACVYAWAIIRPSALAPFAVLALGLFIDLYWGGPLGLWVIALLAAYGLVLSVRGILANEGFVSLWVGYGVATALAMAMGALIILMKTGAVPDLLAIFWQFAATAALYPFAHLLIQRYEDADVRFR